MMDSSVAIVGVPWNVLVACAIGAFCSFGVGERMLRPDMWRLFPVCVFMGAAFTGIGNAALSHWLHVEMTIGLHASLGTAISFITRFFLPWLADVISTGKWINWIPFIGRNKQ